MIMAGQYSHTTQTEASIIESNISEEIWKLIRIPGHVQRKDQEHVCMGTYFRKFCHQLNYVNIPLIYVNLQNNYVHMQLIDVNLRNNYNMSTCQQQNYVANHATCWHINELHVPGRSTPPYVWDLAWGENLQEGYQRTYNIGRAVILSKPWYERSLCNV